MKATNEIISCPICSNRFDIGLTEAMPFCSKRCREIDLNRWMEEEYGVPWEPDPDEIEELEQSSDYQDEN